MHNILYNLGYTYNGLAYAFWLTHSFWHWT